jgi:cupin fold WbuC family metalloprotein
MRKVILSKNETISGVFHANSWGQPLEEDLLEQLIEKAKVNPNRKARLCLHPTPDEILQVTYLAFIRPYADKIHKHPHRPEVVIPVLGEARHTSYDSGGSALESRILNGAIPVAVSTQVETWHALEVISEFFVMVEIGTGPFVPTSTVYQHTS